MIKSVKIKNFESWKDVSFTLSKGVNIFAGDSDKGKSGLIRALKWNTQSRPQGVSFINDFLEDKKESASVSLTFQENTIIERRRNNTPGGINYYRINEQEPMVALRANVPSEVSDLSRIKKTNIQGQHPSEQYFLLSDKPGEVSKKFNRVAGLEIMDKAISDINSQVRATNWKITLCKEEIESREEQLKNLKWVEKAERHAKRVKSLNIKINKNRGELTYLETLIIKLNLITEELEDFKDIKQASEELILLRALSLEKVTLSEQHDVLLRLTEPLIRLDLHLEEYHSISLSLNALKELKKLDVQREETISLVRAILKTVESLEYSERKVNEAKIELEKAIKEFDDLKDTSVCPLCGRG